MQQRWNWIAICTGGALFVGAIGISSTILSDSSSIEIAPMPAAFESVASSDLYMTEPIQPLPVFLRLPADKVALGRSLFFDKKLSRDGSTACASCHRADRGGADGMQRSTGIGGLIGDINAPTVFNAAFNFRQFWNGRAATLEEQIDGPIQREVEMGNTWNAVIAYLQSEDRYRQAFQTIYHDHGISRDTVRDAIATFERSLVTPNAPFDRYLRGSPTAISAHALEGYQLFKSLGCVSCHQGRNVGGNMYQVFGVMEDYFKGRPVTNADLGRFTFTHNESDRFMFKVPSLRNVELTAPYFHDGSAETLEQAILVVGRFQLGRPLSEKEVNALAAFLRTLTGEKPAL